MEKTLRSEDTGLWAGPHRSPKGSGCQEINFSGHREGRGHTCFCCHTIFVSFFILPFNAVLRKGSSTKRVGGKGWEDERLLKTDERFGGRQTWSSFRMGKWPGGIAVWDTQQSIAALRGETEEAVDFILGTRMEADCLDTELHTGTTVMNTTGEQIHPQLIKHLHGVRYHLVPNKQDLVLWWWTTLQGLFGHG